MCQKQCCFLEEETEDLKQTKGDGGAGRREIGTKIDMALGPGSLSFRILKGIAYGTGGKRKVKKDVEGPLTSKWLWQITGKRASDGKANPNLFIGSNTKRIREE